MKKAATVILYNPEETVVFNIKSYAGYFEEIFIFDNSATKNVVHDQIAAIPGVTIMQDFENAGIAQRLNSACKMATDAGYEWLLTMDQDSFFEKEMIENFLLTCELYKDKENVAQFGCNYHPKKKDQNIDPTEYKEESILITSGGLLNLNAFKLIGDFDIAYFIDHVDHDYCIRATLKNYKLIYFPNIFLDHKIGTRKKLASIKSLYFIKKTKVVHNPLRCYYIERNLLYMEYKFRDYNLPVLVVIRGTINKYLKQCLLYNGHYWKTRTYLKLAKKDFANGKMGKISKQL